jgi:hypothetical protein
LGEGSCGKRRRGRDRHRCSAAACGKHTGTNMSILTCTNTKGNFSCSQKRMRICYDICGADTLANTHASTPTHACTRTCTRTRTYISSHCNTLCNTLQHMSRTRLLLVGHKCNALRHTETNCNTLQQMSCTSGPNTPARHGTCNKPHYTATHCNTLQHPATPCIMHRARHSSM